jgi:hypothetical protein
MVLVQGSWRMAVVYGAISIALLLLVHFHVILTPVHHDTANLGTGAQQQQQRQSQSQPAQHHAKHRHHN